MYVAEKKSGTLLLRSYVLSGVKLVYLDIYYSVLPWQSKCLIFYCFEYRAYVLYMRSFLLFTEMMPFDLLTLFSLLVITYALQNFLIYRRFISHIPMQSTKDGYGVRMV